MQRLIATLASSAFFCIGPACASVLPAVPGGGTIEFSFTYDGAPGLGALDGTASFGFFEVEDFLFDLEQVLNIGSLSSGAGAGKVTFNPFHITKHVDKSSPSFIVQGMSGKAGGSTIPVFGFSTFDLAPAATPGEAPLLSPWQAGDPCFELGMCDFSGVLVAYDAPMQVGSFEVTFIPDAVPEPATGALVISGFLAIALMRRHRRRSKTVSRPIFA